MASLEKKLFNCIKITSSSWLKIAIMICLLLINYNCACSKRKIFFIDFCSILIVLASLEILHFGILGLYNSLGARDEFIQPIFYKRFDRFSFWIRKNGLKKQWSAVTSPGELAPGTKLKMPIFILYLPQNLLSRVLVFQKFM